jgi:phospholipase C
MAGVSIRIVRDRRPPCTSRIVAGMLWSVMAGGCPAGIEDGADLLASHQDGGTLDLFVPADLGPDDPPYAAKRRACTFKQGALPSETFGPSIANLAIPIDTIVIVTQENRSFDSYFAGLPAYGQPDVDVEDPKLVSLIDSTGLASSPFHQGAYCFGDTAHDWDSMHRDWNGGLNDGFVKVNDPNGSRTLGYYDASDLGFYYGLANAYGVGDRYFSALLGPTVPNRLYLYAGTSSGHVTNGTVAIGQPSIFKRLEDGQVPFAVYSASRWTIDCAGPASYETGMFCADIPGGSRPMSQFMSDAALGKLPAVSFIDPGDSDEHPPDDMQLGEVAVQKVWNALASSPQWPRSVFIVTFDEAGGLYDHVPPPAACPPDGTSPIVPGEATTAGEFDRLGFRVPFLVASPYAKRHFVSHQVNSHTSILRFLELRFQLPALSDRDANDDALLEFFDFSKPELTPTIPADVVIATPWTKGCPGGALNRYLNPATGTHVVTTGSVGAGLALEQTLGYLFDTVEPNGYTLYGCQTTGDANDQFLSQAANCDGQTVLRAEGNVYGSPPADLATQPLYRCFAPGDHFVSADPACEGKTTQVLLGYAPKSP